jgi:uncharacterized protein
MHHESGFPEQDLLQPPTLATQKNDAPLDTPARRAADAGPESPQPVQAEERIRAIDVLRGFALLGILPMNIIAFAHVEAAYNNPLIAGGFSGWDYAVWLASHLLFDSKMITLFSVLFGAGLFLQVDRAERKRGRVGSARGLYFRRVGWLLLFGLAHAYLLWYGDILTYYALMGMLVYGMRRWSAPRLFLAGLVVILSGSMLLTGLLLASASPSHLEKTLKADEKAVVEARKAEEKVREAGFFQMVSLRAGFTLVTQAKLIPAYALWRILGLMLWGIALIKWHGLEASWPPRAYVRCMLVGFSAGLLLTLTDILIMQLHQFAAFQRELAFFTVANFGSLFMALGYFGLVMLAVQKGWLRRLQDRLAAVGQMAFTNYLMHTLICTFIFHGWGLAQFGLWRRSELIVLVLSIWLLQLALSPIWLHFFRFGPFEWIWRSLTYWHVQPLWRQPRLDLA